jgi:hypothetical protein
MRIASVIFSINTFENKINPIEKIHQQRYLNAFSNEKYFFNKFTFPHQINPK